jgi:hypothetical protein
MDMARDSQISVIPFSVINLAHNETLIDNMKNSSTVIDDYQSDYVTDDI